MADPQRSLPLAAAKLETPIIEIRMDAAEPYVQIHSEFAHYPNGGRVVVLGNGLLREKIVDMDAEPAEIELKNGTIGQTTWGHILRSFLRECLEAAIEHTDTGGARESTVPTSLREKLRDAKGGAAIT